MTERELRAVLTLSPLPDPPPRPSNRFADDDAAAHLGRFLFFDARLSATGTIACSTCHDPARAFTDGRAVAEGIGRVARNTPSLLNVAYQRWFFWDGRADSLWSQALRPLEHPAEMGTTRARLYRLVLEDGPLRAAYSAVFGPLPAVECDLPPDARPVPETPDHPHHQAWVSLGAADREAVDRVFANLGKALAAYQRRLRSQGSPLDALVAAVRRGDDAGAGALSASARRGLSLFLGRGRCTLCHTGPTLTDDEFHNIGLDSGPDRKIDQGRFAGVTLVKADPFNGLGRFSDDRDEHLHRALRFVTRKPNNLGEFKTPSLRNVARTAPYMHDGRFATLHDVVRFYSELDQRAALGHREESLRPLRLTDGEADDLVAFLESLTGDDPPRELLGPPASPSP